MKQDDTRSKLKDPDDKGGDNNVCYYEDKMSLIWPIANSILRFERHATWPATPAAATIPSPMATSTPMRAWATSGTGNCM
ncbi:MAG: hypothetical protein R2856_10520 [Caldilineaceae bacterium]